MPCWHPLPCNIHQICPIICTSISTLPQSVPILGTGIAQSVPSEEYLWHNTLIYGDMRCLLLVFMEHPRLCPWLLWWYTDSMGLTTGDAIGCTSLLGGVADISKHPWYMTLICVGSWTCRRILHSSTGVRIATRLRIYFLFFNLFLKEFFFFVLYGFIFPLLYFYTVLQFYMYLHK